jgi:iron complex outermembrane receptor protein
LQAVIDGDGELVVSRNKTERRSWRIGLTLACAASPLAVAQAQQDGAGAGPVLEEVTVTARKRAENIQDTPVAVTALNAEMLEAHQIVNIADVGKLTPNASFESGANIGGSSSAATFFIRGVGQTDFNLTIDPGVGLYVDGVYMSRSIGALLETLDLEQVEVLRGPQGTLFGKNTIGGAVVLTSKRPSKEFGASVDMTTGSYGRIDTHGMLNIPLNDKLAIRLTASEQRREGYVDRLVDGGRMGNKHADSGRLQVKYDPTDDITLDLSVDGTRTREQGMPVVLLAANPASTFASFSNFALNGATCFTPPTGFPVPDAPQCFTSQWVTHDPYKTWAGGGNFSDLNLWGTALTAEWRLSQVDIKLISSVRHLNSAFSLSTGGAPMVTSITRNDYSQRQWSEELQFSGTAADERVKWLAGLYYLKEKGTDRNGLITSLADFLSGGLVDNDSYASFGQLTFKTSTATSLTLGGRYTYETKRFLPDQYVINDNTGGGILELSRCFVAATPVVPPSPDCVADPVLNPQGNRLLPYEQVSTTARQFTPSVTLDYKPWEDVLTYASYSRGFKSGGFTQRVFPPEPATPSFSPEYVKSYEVGVKIEGLDRRLRWNSAAFYSDYTDMQLIVNDGLAPKVRNAGKAKIPGFETELEFAPVRRVRFSGGLGYLDAHYVTVPTSAAPITVHSQLPNAPRWTGTAAVTADAWTGEAGKLSIDADWSYKGARFLDAANSPNLRQGGYGLLGAGATFESAGSAWSLSVGGTNLTNKVYLISGYSDLATLGSATGAFARPREWYLRGRLNFGGG